MAPNGETIHDLNLEVQNQEVTVHDCTFAGRLGTVSVPCKNSILKSLEGRRHLLNEVGGVGAQLRYRL